MDSSCITVLIIDDEEDMRELIEFVLKGQNYEAVCCSSVAAAKDIIAQKSIDLVISDLKMDDGGGTEVLKFIRNGQYKLPCIIVTGFGEKNSAINALKLGAFDFIEKPFHHEELLSAVSKASEQVRLVREKVEAQERCLGAEKLASVGLLSASIVHEIASPITQVYGKVNRLHRKFESMPVDQVKSDLAKAKVACELVIKIVNSLKNSVRTDNSEGLERNFVPLKSILDDIVVVTADKLRLSKISFDYPSLPDSVLICCDRIAISQVLLNLLNNAIHAAEQEDVKWIQLQCLMTEQQVELSIVDSGPGIKKEQEEKIFEAFYTTKPVGVGTGLGLSTCKKIIEQHSGRIYIDHDCQNTKFSIQLPINAEA